MQINSVPPETVISVSCFVVFITIQMGHTHINTGNVNLSNTVGGSHADKQG